MTMTGCHRVEERISGWLDGELSPGETAELEEHLDCCNRCRLLADDLRAISGAAAGLVESSPETAMPDQGQGWSRLSQQLSRERASSAPEAEPGSRWPVHVALWAVAAAALLALGLGLASMARQSTSPAERRAMSELALLSAQQQRVITSLQDLAEGRQDAWDPELQQVFARSARLVDAAIEECRRAVAQRPGDPELRLALADAYSRKVDFLKVFSGLEEER